MKKAWSQRALRWGALLFLIALPGMMAHAHVRHNEAWARDHFTAAERMREALNGRPPADRTRHDYQRVLNAYRLVYMSAPASSKADPSVVAVADTLVEMGRRFDDEKILKSAISQYKFLRREYPGSKYRFDALFTIGEVYKDDLDDPDQAREAFQEFLHRYPRNRLATDAQQAITELSQEKVAAKKGAGGRNLASKEAPKDSEARNATKESTETKAEAKTGSKTETKGGSKTGTKTNAKDLDANAEEDDDANAAADVNSGSADKSTAPIGTSLSSDSRVSAGHSGHFPRVTGIRHWSTPDYTRVAIDLEGEVDFGAQRISNPDRIYFDLRETKLASTLVGKSFDVDDGFLKKIRVAQYQPGRTRVVLEVEDLSDYDAFLLPDPYRLIIDIHGKDFHRNLQAKELGVKAGKPKSRLVGSAADSSTTTAEESAKNADVEAPPTADAGSDSDTGSETVSTKTPTKVAVHTSTNRQSKALAKTSDTAVKTTTDKTTGVKKVVVEAGSTDESDDSAASTQVAKLEKPSKAKHVEKGDPASPVVSGKPSNDASKADSNATDDDDSSDADLHSQTSDSRTSVREARPTAHGDRSLIRALGLKIGRIVIDPGHGGHDTGTIGPGGLQEKDLVLEVGKRLGKLLESRLGAEVVYTRKDDTFIPLETRTAIANQRRADLFISIHANSSQDPAARGVETYYLNFTSSPDALDVAARENAVSEKSIHELQDLVKKIALKEKIEESREFASDVQESLHTGLAAKTPAIRDRGVKKAPFIVLIGANMPSILAEISFVSNPTDEHRLETSDYRQRIAESLYRGIAKYVNGLSGVKVASKMDRATDAKP